MKNELLSRLLNIILRGLSMGSRLILIIALAKLLEPAEVGAFGLMLATISFSVLIIGADYYVYAQRELLARPPEQWSFVIQHQIRAQAILYAILFPAQLFFFIFDLIDWKYAIWFFSLLLTEHIAQEINRLLTAMHKQLLASLVLFIRLGSWVFIIIPLMYISPQYQKLEALYTTWLIGSLSAIILGAVLIKRSLPVWQPIKTDYTWLKRGFKIGGIFLIATLCFRGLLTFDRYAIESASSIETLGVYVFYISIVLGSYNILDPAIFSFLYPRMLQSYQHNDKQAYQKAFKELILSTLTSSIILGISIWVFTPYAINWIDKFAYTKHLDALAILIAAGFMLSISYIPHFALYAMKADKWIVSAHISALLIFFISIILIHLDSNIKSVATSLLLAFNWMFLIKTIGYFYTKQHSILFKV